jgi:succinate dehydrogenase / fumarate reductase, iron-sulfur subunit
MKTIFLKIYRFDPSCDQKPYFTDYTTTIPSDRDTMLLAVLHQVLRMDPTLAFRRACGEGVCGSDGMNINGKNGLACMTSVNQLSLPITLRPLTGFRILKDLIVDMGQFYQQYQTIEPYVQAEPPLAGEHLQSPEARAQLDGLYECILCGCCTSGCPSSWWNPEKFLGPAALLQALRFVLDSRDSVTSQRLEFLKTAFRLFRCRGVMNCTQVCPKGLNPAKAITALRQKVLVHRSCHAK